MEVLVEVADELGIVACEHTIASPLRQILEESGQAQVAFLIEALLGVAFKGSRGQGSIWTIDEDEVLWTCRCNGILEVPAGNRDILQVLG